MKRSPDPLAEPRFADLLARLRAQTPPEPSADFSTRTLARLRRPAPPRYSWLPRMAAAAAVFALLVGVGWRLFRPVPVSADARPSELLLATQRSDGAWSSDPRNARPRYDVGVTALALLALMHGEPSPLDGPHAHAIRSGMAFLLRKQGIDGRFGEGFSGSGFTQYLAGMAVKTAAQLPRADSDWQAASIRSELLLPPREHMAKLNRMIAHPGAFPARWADAGGPVVLAAVHLLGR